MAESIICPALAIMYSFSGIFEKPSLEVGAFSIGSSCSWGSSMTSECFLYSLAKKEAIGRNLMYGLLNAKCDSGEEFYTLVGKSAELSVLEQEEIEMC